MTDRFICPSCGTRNNYDIENFIFSAFDSHVICKNCQHEIPINNISENEYRKETNGEECRTVLENGTIITITNSDHVWYGQIGIICGSKHKHYRIEVLGKRVWMPTDWVKTNESDNID